MMGELNEFISQGSKKTVRLSRVSVISSRASNFLSSLALLARAQASCPLTK